MELCTLCKCIHIRLYGAFHTPLPISVIMNMGGPVPFLGVVAQQSWYNIMWNILIILSSTIWDNSGRGKFILTLSICTHREHLRIEHFQPGSADLLRIFYASFSNNSANCTSEDLLRLFSSFIDVFIFVFQRNIIPNLIPMDYHNFELISVYLVILYTT